MTGKADREGMTGKGETIMTRHRWRWLAVVSALALVLTACPADDDDVAEPAPDEEPEPDEPDPDPDPEPEPDDEVAEPTGDPINFGFIGSLSGPFAPWGVSVRNGMEMAVEEINAEGGVLGRPLALIERDTGNVPEEGVTALAGMVERDDIVAAGGLISSDVALATSREAEALQVPLFLVKAGSDAILTTESRYTFRTCLPAAPMNMGPLAQFIEDQGMTRVGALIADYAWGRAIEAAVMDQIAELDIELEVQVAPVGEDDFTPYLRRFEEFDPELVISTGHPPGAGPFTRQAADLGLDTLVISSWVPLELIFGAVGDAVFDRYMDFKCVDADSAEFQELATRYYDRFGVFMEDDAVSGYGQILIIAEAIEATGSTDPVELADYIRTNTFHVPGHAWDLEWTEWGEFANAQPILVIFRDQEPPEGVNPGAGWWAESLFQSEPLEPFVP